MQIKSGYAMLSAEVNFMEEIQEIQKQCKYCSHCAGFYLKMPTRFVRAPQSWCYRRRQCVNNGDGCELWERRSHGYSGTRLATQRALRDILQDLHALRQILEEEAQGDD